jgi:hypothetical protein
LRCVGGTCGSCCHFFGALTRDAAWHMSPGGIGKNVVLSLGSDRTAAVVKWGGGAWYSQCSAGHVSGGKVQEVVTPTKCAVSYVCAQQQPMAFGQTALQKCKMHSEPHRNTNAGVMTG